MLTPFTRHTAKGLVDLDLCLKLYNVISDRVAPYLLLGFRSLEVSSGDDFDSYGPGEPLSLSGGGAGLEHLPHLIALCKASLYDLR
jgi:hypothetical protein